jgi:hypothetical protein
MSEGGGAVKSKVEQEEALEGIADDDQLYLYEMFGEREKGENIRHVLLTSIANTYKEGREHQTCSIANTQRRERKETCINVCAVRRVLCAVCCALCDVCTIANPNVTPLLLLLLPPLKVSSSHAVRTTPPFRANSSSRS